MERFIGLDVHAASTTCAVIDARGKRVRVDVVETNGQALIEFLKLQPGTLRLCMEEGTQALWLAEILTPHVAQLAVVRVTESRGPKDDERYALALAEQMRTGVAGDDGLQARGPLRSPEKSGQDARDDRARRGANAKPDPSAVPLAGRTSCGQGGLLDEGARSLDGEAAVERTERPTTGAGASTTASWSRRSPWERTASGRGGPSARRSPASGRRR